MANQGEYNTLTPDEANAVDAIGSLALANSGKNTKLLTESGDGGRPPLSRKADTPARRAAARVLLAVANGQHYRSALEANGISHVDFTLMRQQWTDFGRAFEQAKRIRDAQTSEDAESGLHRLLTDDKCGLNVKAVIHALSQLDAKRWGKRDESTNRQKDGGVSYTVIINGVNVCGNLATTDKAQPTIDIGGNE